MSPLNHWLGLTAMQSALRILFVLTIAVLFAPPSRASGQNLRPERCIECHRQLDDERLTEPVVNYPTDVHARAGFGCLACHGAADGGGRAGFLSKPERS